MITSPQEDIQRIILNIDFVRQWIEFIVEKLFGFGSEMLLRREIFFATIVFYITGLIRHALNPNVRVRSFLVN
jgi:hypothetical protein